MQMDINQIRDLALVERSQLTREMKFIATTTVSALHYLQELSQKHGLPLEAITAEHIIQECREADAILRSDFLAKELSNCRNRKAV
jgi:hypothetical protein